ncbi:hypothetical protein [Nocardioides caricicola]|uniref:Uncharacterized protein n=1 Tax=Nocardioides caricicola TaxID=634770 RepID=A0ABW0N1U8_9ACTN
MATLVLTMALDPRRGDTVVRTVRDEVLPWVRRLPGFTAGRWLRSEDHGCCLVVLDFDTTDDARAVAELLAADAGHPARAWSLEKVVLADQIAVTSRPPALGGAT